MKKFDQLFNGIKRSESKEKVKEILKREYEICMDNSRHYSELLEKDLIKVIKGDSDRISIFDIYAIEKENELSNYIAKIYENLFDEKIVDSKEIETP